MRLHWPFFPLPSSLHVWFHQELMCLRRSLSSSLLAHIWVPPRTWCACAGLSFHSLTGSHVGSTRNWHIQMGLRGCDNQDLRGQCLGHENQRQMAWAMTLWPVGNWLSPLYMDVSLWTDMDDLHILIFELSVSF